MKTIAVMLALSFLNMAEKVEVTTAHVVDSSGPKQARNPTVSNDDIDSRDEDGYNLIYNAVRLNDVKTAAQLVRFGAEINQMYGRERHTLLHIAAIHGSTDVLRWLVEKKNFNINVLDADGWTPLHCAAYNDRVEEVKLLVGYAINRKTKNNMTPTGVAKPKAKAYLKSIGGIE